MDPVQNSVRLSNTVFYNDFGTFCRNWGPIFRPQPLKTQGKSMFLASNLEKPKENRCNPDPRRGEPRVGSAPDVPFPLDPLDPGDPVQNSVRLSNRVFYNDFCTFCRKVITFLGGWPLGRPLGAKMAPDAIWTACGAPFGGLLELMLAPRWPKWRQDEPSWD